MKGVQKMGNEVRLIDVNKVINAMQKCIDEAPVREYPIATYAFQSIIECLKQEPTVDAVEVVRCKDCKHYNDFFGCMDCQLEIGLYLPSPTDFCSYGERKVDGE